MDVNLELFRTIGIALALFISIIVAIITMRNFMKQLRLNLFIDYTKRYQAIILNLPSNIGSKEFDIEKLPLEDKEKTLVYIRAYFDLCSEEYFLWQRGNIEKDVWYEWESGIRHALSQKAFQDVWNKHIESNSTYYKEFTKFMNKMLKESTLDATNA